MIHHVHQLPVTVLFLAILSYHTSYKVQAQRKVTRRDKPAVVLTLIEKLGTSFESTRATKNIIKKFKKKCERDAGRI